MDFISANTRILLVTDTAASANQISLQKTTDAGSTWVTLATWTVGN
jgi:hypothetical protein